VTCDNQPDGTEMRRELDDTAFGDRAAQVTVAVARAGHHDNQVDILGPSSAGSRRSTTSSSSAALLLDKSLAARTPSRVTVFANNTGMGLQFAAVGA